LATASAVAVVFTLVLVLLRWPQLALLRRRVRRA